ncbi:fumarylacetoacetate hydrolase family protein [Xanthobacter tagetidis]|uniref:FAA hydrolase family protein n=1 Tax=Xanthobacter tagetidis TaxID=60216 RepID=A0A3L7AGQ0_9HYPH|nr:fumarylacetoacetate hydrolase family protein [Xanthobacter tagetidis]MBB6306397.1 2-keto-4-pentenoate hydratase/2-oxohepta-3-ene-1,7-dioic acid hydratase in catechol pathway [Xanthobacter tagetidis]RLP79653.1 FAA hydrolase family protein [Xanthobacter tagetidis]
MRLATFRDDGREGVALVQGEGGFIDLTAAGLAADMIDLITNFADRRARIAELGAGGSHVRPAAGATILAPIPRPPRNIFCVGKNYREHAAEFGGSGFDSGAVGGSEIPEYPIFFSKPPSSVIGPEEAIRSDLDPYDSVDYEAELAVVIGRGGRVAEGDDPMGFVFGYTLLNDVTSRELQRRHKQWLLGKGIDTFAPMGPVIVTADEMSDLATPGIRTFVNGEKRQESRLRDLIFDIPTLVRTVGRSITLEPGDVIATGTPAGVGIGFKPPRYLHAGDIVRIEVDGIGSLENPIS